MGDATPKDDVVFTKSSTTTHNDDEEEEEAEETLCAAKDDDEDRGVSNKRFSRLIILTGLTLLLTTLVVAPLSWHLARQKANNKPVEDGGADTTLLRSCKEVDVNLLPFVDGGDTARTDDIRWHYSNTLSYFELDNSCSACYTRSDQFICTDGEKMIFGRYDTETSMGAVGGTSRVCINGTLDLSSLGPVERSKDIILSDISDGFAVTTTYLREEFNLDCEVTGEYEKEDGDTGNRGLQGNSDAVVDRDVPASLPFRGGLKGKPIDKDTIKWVYPEAFKFFGIDAPQMRCYISTDKQLLCTNGRTLVFSEYVQALEAYAVMGKTNHCIHGSFDPRSANATKRTGDIIADDYLDGVSMTKEYIMENTGLECSPVSVRRGLAVSNVQCPTGVALRRQNYTQSISGIVNGSLDHIHSRSAHSITFRACGASYQPVAPKHFSRHSGAGTGTAVGYRFHCKDSFAGTQNPLVRLVSSSGNSSSNGRLRTSYVGWPGCYYNAQQRKITAAYTTCDGYAIDDGITVPQQANIDEFWSKCPGST